MCRLRVPALAFAVTMALLCVATPASAQWPTVVMFYGGSLKEPIVVRAEDNIVVASLFRPASVTPGAITAVSMNDRTFISVACFWGPSADPALNGTTKLSDLKPAMAFQHGRLYPAVAGAPAVAFNTGFIKTPGNIGITSDQISNITMKGRDIYGLLTTANSGVNVSPPPAASGAPAPARAETAAEIAARSKKMMTPAGAPLDPAFYASTGPIGAEALAALKKLGIPVGP